jgi:hypothetical protein
MDQVLMALPATTSNASTPHSVPLKGTQDLSLIHITAGKVQDFNFSISGSSNSQASGVNSLQAFNSQDQPLPRISDLAVSLASQSGSVRILGDTHWNLQSIKAGSNVVLSTKVYAAPTLIGSPVFFTVTVQYIQNGQQLKTDSFDLGAVVVGDIKLEINNIGIRYLGNTPNLVGNLLNEGNTPALFTNIQMIPPQMSSNNSAANSQTTEKGIAIFPLSSDYLGSIPANSPIPFNIPLKIIQQPNRVVEEQRNINTLVNEVDQSHSENIVQNPARLISKQQIANLQSGNEPVLYPVTLNITYSDDLKNSHKLIINKTLGQNFELGQMPNAQSRLEFDNPDQIQNIQSPGGSIFTNGFIDAYWAANSSVCSANSNSSSLSVCSSTSSALPIPPQQEVGPGEGQSIFAVVLSNTEFTDINGIIGYLTLPHGFNSATSIGGGATGTGGVYRNGPTSSNVDQSNISNLSSPGLQQQQQRTAIASFPNVVKSGQTYTLYFKVNIGKGVKVGDYMASLRIFYFKVPALEPGLYNSQSYKIPFSLPGKVILDASSKTTSLKPGLSNTAIIDIKNKGTADANSVLVTITGISGNSIANNVAVNQPGTTSNSNNTPTTSTSPTGQVTTTSPTSSIATVNLGARTFNLGTIPVNGTAEINPVIYPSESAGGTLQNLNLQISYTAATGDLKSSSASVGLLVLPTPPEAGISVGPSVAPSTNSGTSSNSQNNNSNGITSSGITANAYSLDANKQLDKENIRLVPSVYHTTEAHESQITANRGNSIDETDGQSQHFYNVAFSNSGSISKTNTNGGTNIHNNNLNSSSLIVTAGKVQNMIFTISNNNDFPLSNAVASIASESDDLKIVGDSLWSISSFAPHSTHAFTTKVYASTSLIAAPVSFLVTLQYISGGQSKIGSFVLGGNVVGDIRVSVTDLAVNYVAGTPNLVGNLLNQGNTIGLYTTAQLVNQPFSSSQVLQHRNNQPSHQSGSHDQPRNSNPQSTGSSTSLFFPPPPQYLGDLQPDSPLPFSIPLTNVDNSTIMGSHPVSLKITYSDDLKNSHEITINQTLQVKPQISHIRGDRHGQNTVFGIPLPVIILIIIAIVAFIIVRMIRKRRRDRAEALAASETGEPRADEDDIEKLLDSSDSTEAGPQNIEDRKSSVRKK